MTTRTGNNQIKIESVKLHPNCYAEEINFKQLNCLHLTDLTADLVRDRRVRPEKSLHSEHIFSAFKRAMTLRNVLQKQALFFDLYLAV